ncbi:MAG TPA: ACP S-malonyltransferase [Xanthomonadaceae bacterium]
MNTGMKTCMFPGQGSQSKGMGGELFERFAALTAKADDILGYSIRELCLDDPRGELNDTRFTQPALYTVNALSYLRAIEDGEGEPDFLAGHSLGEFNALQAAGCFDFETGLRLVQKRGALMGKVSGGGMAAVINAPADLIRATLDENGLDEIFLANYNSPSQIVVSGSAEQIGKAGGVFNKLKSDLGKVRFLPLNTSGAFHSRFMRDAMGEFRTFLATMPLSAPRIPVLANVTARPYTDDAILDTLADQIANTVKWCESVQYLLALARSRGQEMRFLEFGPGEVLTRMVDAIRKQTPDTVLDGFFPVATRTATAAGNDAARKVADWNQRHPVGTRVRSTVFDYDSLETRSEAVVLFGHRAAIYMKGYNGYFDLNELQPA